MHLFAWAVMAVVLFGVPATGGPAPDIPIPSQADWASAKKTVKLASGLTLASVEMGNPNGTPTLLTEVSRSFAAELKSRYNKPVALVDERLSSREAESQLRDARASGMKKRRNTHADVDMIAARILLEQWLENPHAAEQAT